MRQTAARAHHNSGGIRARHQDTDTFAVITTSAPHGMEDIHDRSPVVVEPAESSVLLGGPPGPHKIEGVGIGYTPPLYEPALVDEVVAVKTADAKEMARRLAREEALFAGTSSGANVVAALEVAERLGPNATVVTLMADSGLKYASTDVYRKG